MWGLDKDSCGLECYTCLTGKFLRQVDQFCNGFVSQFSDFLHASRRIGVSAVRIEAFKGHASIPIQGQQNLLDVVVTFGRYSGPWVAAVDFDKDWPSGKKLDYKRRTFAKRLQLLEVCNNDKPDINFCTHREQFTFAYQGLLVGGFQDSKTLAPSMFPIMTWYSSSFSCKSVFLCMWHSNKTWPYKMSSKPDSA